MFKKGWFMRKLIWLAAATVAIAGAGLAEAQDTPRKGGTIRMTAPYAASFGSLDPHTTPRAQDEIVSKALQSHALQLGFGQEQAGARAGDVGDASAEDGLTYTYKLRDDAYFHNGRKMTADDIIWSFTRIMDGSKGYPGGALRPHHQGRDRRREGPGQGDLRPQEDRRLHARDDAHRHASTRATISSTARPRSCPRKRSRRATSPPIRSAWARSSSRSTFPARASWPSAGRSSTSPASPTPTASRC